MTNRENFGSRATVIMAMAGSAIGLGNIWRFPFIVGEYGGAAFILVYIFCCFLLSMPILLSETIIGRSTHQGTFGAMNTLAPGSGWKWLGLLTVFSPLIILSYYSVVGGWSFAYLCKAVSFQFKPENAEAVTSMFGQFSSSTWGPLACMFIFLFLTALIVYLGVNKGIERFSKISIPVLFVLIVTIAVYSITLPGAGEGVKYLVKPDFSKLTPGAYAAALGQSFFSLSLGVGTMLTYASYVSKDENIIVSASGTAFFDLLFAILAGFAVMPAVFAAGIAPSSGPGLVFETLPFIFAKMGAGGQIISASVAILFFLTILVAALSSSISMMEVGVAYLVEEKNYSRHSATVLLFLVTLVIGVLCSLSFGVLSDVKLLGQTIFNFCDRLASNFLMTIGALLFSVFVGWKMNKATVKDELTNGGKIKSSNKFFPVVYFLIKYVAPVTIAAIFIIGLVGCSSPTTVHLKDYMDESSSEDAMPAIRAALDDCVRQKASKLVLPGDTLLIKPAKAYEEYQYISNNDPSMKRIAFQLKGMSDFTIEGNGTTLLFSGHISPFNLEGCANISVKDLTIDFKRAFVSEGEVTAVGKGFFELQFPDSYETTFREGNLVFRDENKETYPYSSLLEFDSSKKEVAYHVHDYWIWTESSQATQVGPNRFRFYRDDYGEATIGNVMALGASTRNNPAFTLLDCEGFKLTDVKLYNCCGMGVIAQSSKDIELLRMDVEPTPGSDRIISISADATHFVNCKGYIRMIDCVFKNQKDDATNVHGWYMAVDKVLSPDKLLLRWRNTGQYGVRFIKPGMTLEIVDSQIMEARDRKVVKEVDYLNSEYAEVSFTEPLPESVVEGDVVAEDDAYPDVLISGCYIGNNRARGLLIGSRGKVVIEKNTFHTPGTSILFEGDGRYWYEQSGVRDVTIRDNVFDNCMYGSATWGSAVIAVGSGIPDREHSRYHKNILVENNTFRGFDHRIVNLYCVDGFTFKDNKIEFTDADYPAFGSPEDRFIFKNCDNVKVQE